MSQAKIAMSRVIRDIAQAGRAEKILWVTGPTALTVQLTVGTGTLFRVILAVGFAAAAAVRLGLFTKVWPHVPVWARWVLAAQAALVVSAWLLFSAAVGVYLAVASTIVAAGIYLVRRQHGDVGEVEL